MVELWVDDFIMHSNFNKSCCNSSNNYEHILDYIHALCCSLICSFYHGWDIHWWVKHPISKALQSYKLDNFPYSRIDNRFLPLFLPTHDHWYLYQYWRSCLGLTSVHNTFIIITSIGLILGSCNWGVKGTREISPGNICCSSRILCYRDPIRVLDCI